MALLLGAFIIHGLQPGPLMIANNPGLFFGIVASMYIGNVMLLVLNLPLVGLFVRLLHVPMRLLLPVIMVICVIGVYNANQQVLDLLFLCAFGVLGYYMRRHSYPVAPVILGLVLGVRMEEALRQSMIMSQGNLLQLVERPIVAAFLVLTVLFLCLPMILRRLRFRGRKVELETEG
jgi:putative tricarboxylic transport membrane protein